MLFDLAVVWSRQGKFPTGLMSNCSSLLEKIASNVSDLDVYDAVTELLVAFSRPSTPTQIVAARESEILDTPTRPNSGNSMTESQVH